MCGIAGIVDRGIAPERWPTLLDAMASSLRHRGPDDSGLWFDAEVGLGFAHARLAIIDLSPHGHQPMVSRDGRYVLAFNGEIYNFAELRHELTARGHVFRGHCDTEVMLAAFVQWGLGGALDRFHGMFAFALWDARERRLHLARDRIGEKPLYYGRVGKGLAFASELKALRTHPEFGNGVDRSSLALLLGHGYIPAPASIYEGIGKLPAGTFVTIDPTAPDPPPPVPYWTASAVAERGAARPLDLPAEEVIEQLDARAREAVRRRLVADVPLGAFLSGGVDSSLVVAQMQALSARPVKTFTIGFADPRFDETPWARAVAEHLGTDHTEWQVTAAEAMELIPQLPAIYDEPLADASQIPTCLVSRLARSEVTVVLSGDGGDELFGGYERYREAETLWRWLRLLRPLPLPARRLLGRLPLPGRLGRLAMILDADRLETLYRYLFLQCPTPTRTVLGAGPMAESPRPALTERKARLMYLDLTGYLPENVLVKLDRASMRVGLEGRLPLLDSEVVEFAWQVPLALKIRDGRGKWILRRVLDRYVPRPLIERPKMGFEVPIGDWLRGPLRPWAEALLEPARLRREGYLRAEVVGRRWREHLGRRRDWRFFLWSVLSFQQWRENASHSMP
jgi:asparagine synthase (glutamine-hydrolysing)